ncbi:hypothetical protein Trydic_g6514 [Trypoxylus dichotomus]
MRLVIDGFAYHNNIVAGSPPLRYLGCSELRQLGCRGRATIPVNGDPTQLKLTHPHNHPPDLYAEEKVTFVKELRRLVQQMEQCTLKQVYETVAELYPMAAMEISFKSICSSLHRWRKEK